MMSDSFASPPKEAFCVCPRLSIFWSILTFFGFFLWIWVLIAVFVEIFRGPDLSGLSKAMRFFLVLVVPLVGVLIYLIARGHKMPEHAAEAGRQGRAGFERSPSAAGPGGSAAGQLEPLADLRDRGAITAEEYDQQKVRVLG